MARPGSAGPRQAQPAIASRATCRAVEIYECVACGRCTQRNANSPGAKAIMMGFCTAVHCTHSGVPTNGLG
eukprot:13955-Chlamydomonas_euryale.AAC.1